MGRICAVRYGGGKWASRAACLGRQFKAVGESPFGFRCDVLCDGRIGFTLLLFAEILDSRNAACRNYRGKTLCCEEAFPSITGALAAVAAFQQVPAFFE